MATVTTTTTETTRSKSSRNTKLSEESEKIYKKVLEDSPFIFGNDGDLIPVETVSWLNPTLVKHGLDWFREFIALYTAATVIAMISTAVAIKPISALIFRNDKPMKPDAYFRRFLGKLRGIERFFDNLMDPEEAQKVFYRTRKLHALATVRLEKVGEGKPLPEILVMEETQWIRDITDAVQKDMSILAKRVERSNLPQHIDENLSWNAKLPFNQFGLVYFTAGFFGVVWRRPRLFGMKDGRKDEKMKGFIHVWAIIAKLLGLQDEFNIFINPDPVLIDRVIRDVYVESMLNIDTTVVYLQHMVTQGVLSHIPFLTLPTCLYLAMQTLGCETLDNMWNVMGIWDKFLLRLIQTTFYLSGTVAWFRHMTNWVLETYVHWLYTKVLDKIDDKYKF